MIEYGCRASGTGGHRWEGYGKEWPKGFRSCNGCGEILSLNLFHKYKRGKFGRMGVCKTCRKKSSKSFWDIKTPESKIFDRAKARAESKGVPFNLKIEDIIIPALCPVFNKPIKVPSIDRHVPSLGYVKGNVFIMENRANMLKNDATIEELKMIIEYMESKEDI